MVLPDLVWLFEQAALATYGTDLFIGSKAVLPKTYPGPICTLVETGGLNPAGTHNRTDVPAYVRPSVQVMWRGRIYDDARAKSQASYELIYPVRNRFVNGTWWVSVLMKQEPFDLGPDDVGRPRIVFNVDIFKRLSPATSV